MPTDLTPTDEQLDSLILRLEITYPWHDHVDAGGEIMRQAWNSMHSSRREAAAALRELRSARARVAELEAIVERCGIIARAGKMDGNAGWRFSEIAAQCAAAAKGGE